VLPFSFLKNFSLQQSSQNGEKTMRNELSKITLAAVAVKFTMSMAFAADMPKSCTDEIMSLSRVESFDMQKFMSELPSAVAKVKLQVKMPFGKPKDSDKTSIGMSVGCLKAFPESPGELQSLLKNVSMEIARNAIANQLQPNEQGMLQAQLQPQQYTPQPEPQPQYQYPPQQAQPQYQYPQQQAQPQYQYPPQQVQPQYQYPPQQQAQPQYQYPPQQAQYKCECDCGDKTDNFTAGERWGTWALNTIIPGLGSAAIMSDWVGMGIQLGLTTFGAVFILAFGTKEEEYCRYYNDGRCIGYSYETRENPEFITFGTVLLVSNYIFNIARSNSYNKPSPNRYSSAEHGGFNLAALNP
jgi:hypothetical protein